jgi:hypothetical protein
MQGDPVMITGNGPPLMTFQLATGISFTLSGTKGKHRLADFAFLLESSSEVGSILQQNSTRNTHSKRQVLVIGDTYQVLGTGTHKQL